MKKWKHLILYTWYGATTLWSALGVLLIGIGIFAARQGMDGVDDLLMGVFLALLVSSLGMCAVIVRTLVKRRWGLAIGQFVIGFLSFIMVINIAFALVLMSSCSFFNTGNFKPEEEPWRATTITETLPFSVEYRHAHPFLAEYHRRIGFKSGKRVVVLTDTGGARDFAVYALTDGKFYLMDGLDFAWIRSEYRVDPVAECVEKRCGGKWLRIPGRTIAITGWSDEDIYIETESGSEFVKEGVPVGDSLDGKRFLGRISPRGTFTAGGEEPIPAPADDKNSD